MKRLYKLLFELSSAERINILLELRKNVLKMSQVSRKLNMTVTETDRHLQRLSETTLIQRNSEGYFELTPFGELTISLLSGIGFASMYREYFTEHNVSEIPYEFIERMGELEAGTYAGEALKNLEEGEIRIRGAQKFIWILSDEVLASSIPLLIEKIKSPFDLRIVLPEGKFSPESTSRLPLAMGVQKRILQKVDVLIVLTERFAIFCLPNRRGKIDYTGFVGTDPKFHKWCKDLFLYYWEKAKPSYR